MPAGGDGKLTKLLTVERLPERTVTLTHTVYESARPERCYFTEVTSTTSIWDCHRLQADSDASRGTGTGVIEAEGEPHELCEKIGETTITNSVEVCEPARAARTYTVTETITLPETIVEAIGEGWDAGAYSVGTLSGDGSFRFEVPVSAWGVIAGLRQPRTPVDSYREIDFGILFSDGFYRILENGIARTAPVAYTAGDVFEVRRIRGEIRYVREGTVVYTSTAPGETLWAGGALYLTGDSIEGAILVDETEVVGSHPIGFQSLVSDQTTMPFRIQGPIGFESTAAYRPSIDASPSLGWTSAASSSLVVRPAEAGGGTALGFRSQAENIPALVGSPQGVESYFGLSAFGWAIPGEVVNPSPPLGFYSWASDTLQARGQPALGFGSMAFGLGSIGNLVNARLALPAPRPRGQLVTTYNDARLPLPVPRPRGDFGGIARIGLPAPRPRGTIDAENLFIGRVPLPAPRPRVEALTGNVMIGRLVLPAPRPLGVFAGNARVPLPAPRPRGEGLTGNILKGRLPLPVMRPTGEGIAGNVMTGRLPIGFKAPYGGIRLRFGLPAPRPRGEFQVVLTDDGRAYVINLANGAITEYTGYPAIGRVVRVNGRHFAVAGGNLIELTGDTDDGADIAARARTGYEDIDTNMMKRPSGIFFDIRESDGLSVQVVGDEDEISPTYAVATNNEGPGLHTRRVKIGRGLKYTRLAVEFTNVDGGRSDVGGFEIEQEPISRKIRRR